MRRLGTFLAALLLPAAPAAANWQFTHWGMSLPALVAASPTRVVVQDYPELKFRGTVVKGGTPYEVGGVRFAAFFGFDDRGGLNQVILIPVPKSRCGAVSTMLRDVYGRPEADAGLRGAFWLTKWRDAEAGNLVSISVTDGWENPTTCLIVYEAIPRGL